MRAYTIGIAIKKKLAQILSPAPLEDAPVSSEPISIRQATVFPSENSRQGYLCHVHFFVHNFTSESINVVDLHCMMDELLLDLVVPEEYEIDADAIDFPMLIEPGNFIEQHAYFHVRSVLSGNRAVITVVTDTASFERACYVSLQR